MAYRFKLGERIDKGFVRIGASQLQRCEQELGGDGEAAPAIHETRKALKRVRALLRLGAGGLDKATFQRENRRLRDVARTLAGSRDAHVIGVTLAAVGSVAPASANGALAAMRAELDAHDTHEGATTARAAALREITAARQAFAAITLSGNGFDVLAPGLKRVYRDGRKVFGACQPAQSDEAHHEARKLVQLHWRHMALFLRCWPDAIGARVRLARGLSEILGQDHDLAMLRASAAKHLAVRHARTIDGIAREMQAGLRERSAPLGHMLFAEKPAELADRIGRYWAAAVNVGEADGEAVGARRQAGDATEAGKSDPGVLRVVSAARQRPSRART